MKIMIKLFGTWETCEIGVPDGIDLDKINLRIIGANQLGPIYLYENDGEKCFFLVPCNKTNPVSLFVIGDIKSDAGQICDALIFVRCTKNATAGKNWFSKKSQNLNLDPSIVPRIALVIDGNIAHKRGISIKRLRWKLTTDF